MDDAQAPAVPPGWGRLGAGERAAVLTPPPLKWSRISEDEKVQIMAAYKRGVPIRRIAVSLNRSYAGVYRVLRAAGMELRPRGGQPRRKT